MSLQAISLKKFTSSITLIVKVKYRTECTICRIQCINKSETQFNLRLNNHQKDVNRQNASLVDQHFKLPGGNFNQRAKFILIEQLGSQYKHK